MGIFHPNTSMTYNWKYLNDWKRTQCLEKYMLVLFWMALTMAINLSKNHDWSIYKNTNGHLVWNKVVTLQSEMTSWWYELQCNSIEEKVSYLQKCLQVTEVVAEENLTVQVYAQYQDTVQHLWRNYLPEMVVTFTW